MPFATTFVNGMYCAAVTVLLPISQNIAEMHHVLGPRRQLRNSSEDESDVISSVSPSLSNPRSPLPVTQHSSQLGCDRSPIMT